jgi:hypothetical protein
MARRAAAVLFVLSFTAPGAYAQQSATTIRDSIANMRFNDEPPARAVRASQGVAIARRTHPNATVVVALAVLGMYGGSFVADRVALPCHCGDPEAVLARGGLVGAVAGAVAGIILTSR